jgi:hypothetical protein
VAGDNISAKVTRATPLIKSIGMCKSVSTNSYSVDPKEAIRREICNKAGMNISKIWELYN